MSEESEKVNYIGVWHHGHGVDILRFRTSRTMDEVLNSEDEIVRKLGVDFEPEKGECIDIQVWGDDEFVDVDEEGE